MLEYILYHSLICPFSKKVRFILDEYDIKYKSFEVNVWNRDKEFIKLNPANETPVLKNVFENQIICDSYIIAEYLDEKTRKDGEFAWFNMSGDNEKERLEIKRLHMWFDKRFYQEITFYLIEEIFHRTFNNDSLVDIERLNVASANLDRHIRYIEYLLTKRKWLACEKFSLADVAAAAQLSIVDYLAYVNWDKYPKLKDWYIIIKSKKGFRNILQDKIPGFLASRYYKELDF